MRWCGFSLLAVLAACATGLDLGDEYMTTVRRADSLYQAHRYVEALASYATARDLLPTEPGPMVGIGWTLLQMGEYDSAEAMFRRVLAVWPAARRAREGLNLLPVRYRLKLTASVAGSPDSAGIVSAFVEYNHHYRTTVAAGFQSIGVRRTFQGLNAALVVYHRLRYPWSARLDFYMLSSGNDPSHWRVVYAPSVGRRFGEWRARVALVGWDWLGTAGVQVSAERRVGSWLLAGGAPAFNLASGKPGWYVPVALSFPVREWLVLRAGGGIGSIADHVDMDNPSLYSQPERLVATVCFGADFLIRRRYRVAGFAAYERYDNDTGRRFLSLTLSARL